LLSDQLTTLRSIRRGNELDEQTTTIELLDNETFIDRSCECHAQNSSVIIVKEYSVNVLIFSFGIVLTIPLHVFVVVQEL
jgi:hypothetical protein